ncbi:uncharacterized protein EI97DRAFT_435277 [Westerdykella ornata]|uniref:Inhibitor I9 domain-containing protein n=1 Tax=Westerdykella ornata TaxID=318751 RepID=A0A6A6JDU3_WESOR|nr:uncharacterized protein EI97DRAFT_435277 [Westerdykella ornata]KAF2274168.1 hypothetical protein EI97DRAFT_435277 [Westerdykella ornata]
MRMPTLQLLSVLVAILATFAMAVAPPLKRVIVSYPNETPQSVVDEAMEAIVKAGGAIIHKYNIIKGFTADAPATVLETVEVLSSKFSATVEEDGIVHTMGN